MKWLFHMLQSHLLLSYVMDHKCLIFLHCLISYLYHVETESLMGTVCNWIWVPACVFGIQDLQNTLLLWLSLKLTLWSVLLSVFLFFCFFTVYFVFVLFTRVRYPKHSKRSSLAFLTFMFYDLDLYLVELLKGDHNMSEAWRSWFYSLLHQEHLG